MLVWQFTRRSFHYRFMSTMVDPLKDSQVFLNRKKGERGSVEPGEATNLLQPHLWFPKARKLKRTIICHLGPTNSGKTYRAIERLKQSESGIYCGPLRLLAWEIFENLNEVNIPCSLRTGQETEEKEGANVVSCTTEMVDVSQEYDVAVIDEIQLIGDQDRGWAWTRALLGLPASEIHLCGEPAALPIITRLCEATNDELIVRNYERLGPLDVSGDAIKSLKDVRRGDAVIAFSRRELFSLKRSIEKETGQNCCIVYGALPPEVRRQQAKLFNDINKPNYSIIVATDAIGMGLNLNIGRVVFSNLRKYDGMSERPLMPNEIKQIGGRAGRFHSIYPNGSVTCILNEKENSNWICMKCGGVNFDRRRKCFRCHVDRSFQNDSVGELRPQGESGKSGATGMNFIRKMMAIDNPELMTAGLAPTEEHLAVFADSTSVLHLMVPTNNNNDDGGGGNDSLKTLQEYVDENFFGEKFGSVVTISKRTTESRFASRQQYEKARHKKAHKKSKNETARNRRKKIFRPVSISGTAKQLRFTVEYMLGQLDIDDVWYIAVPTSKLLAGDKDSIQDRLMEMTSHTEGCIIEMADNESSSEIPTSVIPGTTLLKFTGTQPFGVLEGVGTMCEGDYSLFKASPPPAATTTKIDDSMSKWSSMLDDSDEGSSSSSSSSSSSNSNVENVDDLDLPFSHMLISFHRAVQLDSNLYHMMNVDEMLDIAKSIDHLSMPISTRFTLCRAPLNLNNKTVLDAFLNYSTSLSKNESVAFLMEVPKEVPSNSKQMEAMETDFKVIECYIWLARRFPEQFPDEDRAKNIQVMFQQMIEDGLAQLSEEAAAKYLGQKKKKRGNTGNRGNRGNRRGRGRGRPVGINT